MQKRKGLHLLSINHVFGTRNRSSSLRLIAGITAWKGVGADIRSLCLSYDLSEAMGIESAFPAGFERHRRLKFFVRTLLHRFEHL